MPGGDDNAEQAPATNDDAPAGAENDIGLEDLGAFGGKDAAALAVLKVAQKVLSTNKSSHIVTREDGRGYDELSLNAKFFKAEASVASLEVIVDAHIAMLLRSELAPEHSKVSEQRAGRRVAVGDLDNACCVRESGLRRATDVAEAALDGERQELH